jgi:hypothetical protein
VDEVLLIAGTRDGVIADYAAYASLVGGLRVSVISSADVCRRIKERAELHPVEEFSPSLYLEAHSHDRLAGVVIFLSRDESKRDYKLLEMATEIATAKGAACVCLVSSFRAHFGDQRAKQSEEAAINRLRRFPGRVVVFRPSRINSPRSGLSESLRKYRSLAAVVPERFKSCCVDGEELFAAFGQELKSTDSRKHRTFTLLGSNQSWKELLARKSNGHPVPTFIHRAVLLLRLLLLGQIAGLMFDFFVRWFPRLRVWNFDTLRPNSMRELLSLYNKYNYRHVKIVGYNNGVIHFGHHHPGKTILSTVSCNRVARVQGDLARFDAGSTIRQAMEMLKADGKELHVIPNYTYVSIGTTFFVPIHGSANQYCTVADTIEKVLLYDPVDDQFITGCRQDADFGRYLYNLSADVLLLQLSLRVKQKSRYYVKVQKLANLSSEQILSFFKDTRVSNVEIRKAGAASQEVKVYQYYTTPPDGDSDGMELPRDPLGSLWDRLESNPLTSVLFHGLVRRFAYHVELFLPEDDFAVFWETHGKLPLSKIQLRYIRRDGFPNSPFREHDCVSVDLFMLKKHKRAFEAYVQSTFRAARMNPGKHSM